MKNEKRIKQGLFVKLTEVFGWLQIFTSPFLLSVVAGFIVYLILPGILGIIIASLVAGFEFIIGNVFATRVWKKDGTVHFISRVSASPELDNLDSDG